MMQAVAGARLFDMVKGSAMLSSRVKAASAAITGKTGEY